MNPSKQLLKHLRSLVHGSAPGCTAARVASTRTLRSSKYRSNVVSSRHSSQHKEYHTLYKTNTLPSSQPQNVRSISTTSANLAQPRASSTSHPSTPEESPSSPSSSSSLPNLKNHYTLFPSTINSSLPPPHSPFHVPLPTLRREFLNLQSRYHPDKFPLDQKPRAEALSSQINTAYKTLADPLLRAQYILNEFHGVDVLAEDQGSAQQDPETLMEVMEVQEAIEGAGEESEIEELKTENKRRIDDTVAQLGTAIDGGDIDAAKRECIKLRFWRSLQDGLDTWEPGKEVRLIH